MEDPLVPTPPCEKPSLFKRRRRTFLVSGAAVVFAVAMAVVWTVTTTPSKSDYITTDKKTGQTTVNVPARRQSIVVLGDSSTQYGGYAQGWEVLLHEAYVRTLDTINRGLSGYNTRVYLEFVMPGLIDEVTHYYKPAVVVLWFGVNDATLVDGPNRAQHVPVDEYKQNLIEMIQQFRLAAPDAKVLLLSPGYIDEKQRLAAMLRDGRKASDPLDRNNNETIKYAAACTEIKDTTFQNDDHVGYVDVYKYFLDKYPSDENRVKILKDGLHFSPTGDRVFYELVKDKIESMLPADVYKTMQFPYDSVLIDY